MSDATPIDQRWVAFGEAGALGTIHRTGDVFQMKLLSDPDYRGSYPSLDIAKSALNAALLPGTEVTEFKEH